MPEIKLIALDLDDTLLKDDLQISPRAKQAIINAVGQGVHVTLATGRMFQSALPFAEELGLDLPLITYQGALVKYPDGRVIYHQPLPLDLAHELIDFLEPYGYHLNVYIDDELYIAENSPEGGRYAKVVRVPLHVCADLKNEIKKDPTKLLVISDEVKLDKLAEDLRAKYGDTLNITKSKSYFLEIAHAQTGKGRALAELAKSLNIAQESVMAIGDSYNDLDMLEYAGLGVAMENACPSAKKLAQYITKSNNDDGVAEAIEIFVLSRE